MESSLGQFAGTGCITVFRISPIFKGNFQRQLVIISNDYVVLLKNWERDRKFADIWPIS